MSVIDPDNARFELLSAYLDGELADHERAEVEALLERDAEAVACLEQLREVQTTLRAIPADAAPHGFADEVMAAAERQILLGEVESAPPRRLHWGAWSAAAAIVLMIGLAGTLMVTQRDRARRSEHAVALNEPSRRAAGDESRVRQPPGEAPAPADIAMKPLVTATEAADADGRMVELQGALDRLKDKEMSDRDRANFARLREQLEEAARPAVAAKGGKSVEEGAASAVASRQDVDLEADDGDMLLGVMALLEPATARAQPPIELSLTFADAGQADRFVERWAHNLPMNEFKWSSGGTRQYLVSTTTGAISTMLDDFADEIDVDADPASVQMKIGAQEISGWLLARRFVGQPGLLDGGSHDTRTGTYWQEYFGRFAEARRVAGRETSADDDPECAEDESAQPPLANVPAKLDELQKSEKNKPRQARKATAVAPRPVTLMLTIRQPEAKTAPTIEPRPASPRINPRPERRPRAPADGQRRD